ncbi:hypothetical protein ACIA78_26825 [Streptomyces xanthochromogenes]|uniref:hypothetical protein n=1 Tax=Streptomyces xanthochromogenes TaxID=67384 RepID=UPI0037970149
MSTSSSSVPPRISKMAAGELRDALMAIELGHGPTAVAALMAIDEESWQGIEKRLAALVGDDLRSLLLAAVTRSPLI